MIFRLVSSGVPHYGLTGRGVLDTVALDVLLDFAYGMLIEHADKKQRAELDRSLAAFDKVQNRANPGKMVEFTRRDGSTILVSEARLAEIQANVTNIGHMRHRKG